MKDIGAEEAGFDRLSDSAFFPFLVFNKSLRPVPRTCSSSSWSSSGARLVTVTDIAELESKGSPVEELVAATFLFLIFLSFRFLVSSASGMSNSARSAGCLFLCDFGLDSGFRSILGFELSSSRGGLSIGGQYGGSLFMMVSKRFRNSSASLTSMCSAPLNAAAFLLMSSKAARSSDGLAYFPREKLSSIISRQIGFSTTS